MTKLSALQATCATSFAITACMPTSVSASIFCWTAICSQRIVGLAGDLDGRTVLEVGPGPGGLTRALLQSERRSRHCDRTRSALHRGPWQELIDRGGLVRLTVIEADALDRRSRPELADGGRKADSIVANLPYNVGTALSCCAGWIIWPASMAMTLMFQREVADRLDRVAAQQKLMAGCPCWCPGFASRSA